MERLIKINEDWANDTLHDNNKITMLIFTSFTMRTIYLIVVIFTIVYFVGLAWFDLVRALYLANKEEIAAGRTNQSFFYQNFLEG